MQKTERVASILLRVGLAFAFLYVAIASFIAPQNWIGYFPTFMRTLLGDTVLLPVFSVYEILLGLWLLSGWKAFYSGLLSVLTLIGIVANNLNQMDVVFRDVTIIFAALALSALHYKKSLPETDV